MHGIEVNQLKKSFGELAAVQGVSFVAEKGEILTLLGPNGSGKSTIIAMLCGLLAPDGGDATIMGHSVTKAPSLAKASLGVVPQEIALYPDLSARENLAFWGRMYGLRGAALRCRVDDVLEITGLTDRQRDPVGNYSGGMKRRVNIGAALLHQPDVVIMDEPTVGIDPQSRRHILDNVRRLNRNGMTVLYTTHYMEEAGELSDHIAILDKGMVIAYGEQEELTRLVGKKTRIELTLDPESAPIVEAWRSITGISSVEANNGRVTMLSDESDRILPRLFEAAAQAGVRISTVVVQEPNLEAVFLHLTGRTLRDQRTGNGLSRLAD